MSRITEEVTKLARPIVEDFGCELWDVEFVKEAGTHYLRVFIDKEGGVSIDDCEAVSRAVDPLLDEADLISDSYVFEVGSPGAERELKRPSDFDRFMGHEVEVRTYAPVNGKKSFIGTLAGYDDGTVSVTEGSETISISGSDVALVKLHVSF